MFLLYIVVRGMFFYGLMGRNATIRSFIRRCCLSEKIYYPIKMNVHAMHQYHQNHKSSLITHLARAKHPIKDPNLAVRYPLRNLGDLNIPRLNLAQN